MLDDFADLFAQEPPLRWFIGRVLDIENGTLTIDYRGARVVNVGYLDQYVPQVDDVVQCISLEGTGVLALGSNNKPTATGPQLQEDLVWMAGPAGTYGWSETAVQWIPLPLPLQNEDTALVWTYSLGELQNQLAELSSVELELSGYSRDNPYLVLHHSDSAGGSPLDVIAGPWPVRLPAQGWELGPVWVPIPIEWGTMLMLGQARGLAIGLGAGSSALEGTGRLRFTGIPARS